MLVIIIAALIVDTVLPKPRIDQDASWDALGTGWDWLRTSKVPMRLTRRRCFRGAMYDAFRHRIYVAVGSFASSDFITLWSVAHELRHPQQIGRWWTAIFWIKWMAEGLMLIALIARVLLTLRLWAVAAPYFTSTIMMSSVVLWGIGHMLLEYDACLWAPVNLWQYAVQRSCSLEQQRGVLEHAVRYSRVQIVTASEGGRAGHFLMTVAFASMYVLLFVIAHGVFLRWF